jgi:hypothetical protein
MLGMGAGLACGLALLAGAAALAADDEHHDGALETWWDGDTLNVPWDGSDHYVTIADGKFHHDAVAVPGDWIYRTLVVRNNGKCGGTLTVSILEPESHESPDTVNHDDISVTEGRTGFEGMSEVHWQVGDLTGASSFAALGHQQVLATVPIAKAGSIPVSLAYRFPYEETEGKHLGLPSQALVWNVGLRLHGDYCSVEDYTGEPTPTDFPSSGSPTTPGPTSSGGGVPSGPDSSASGGGSGQDKLEWTGSNIAFGAISAAFLIAAGLTIVLGRYRDRRMRGPA